MGTLNMVAESVSGTLIGADRSFDSVSTDTRSLTPGQLFFALRGERFDAAAFIADAERRGAAGAVVAQRQAVDLPQVEVADTQIALGALAGTWRARFDVPVVAVTGSNGKTTVKEMIAAVLRGHFGGADTTLATLGNLNNEIGLPLTVLRLRTAHAAAVLEMGAARPGDVAYLTDIAAPTIGIVTNAGAAHLAGFGSEQVVAETKGELFAGLGAAGTAVINLDDPHAGLWRRLAGPARIVTFGLHEAADYRAENIRQTVTPQGFELSFDVREATDRYSIRLPMVGRHNVLNALGAIAVARAAGAAWDSIGAVFAAIENVAGRLRTLRGRGGIRLIDDTYNANPVSVCAAIDVLADLPGYRWLILGDMAELGERSSALHADVGRHAQAAGIDRLWTLGACAQHAADAFGDEARAFDTRAALVAAVAADPDAGRDGDCTVLVKGSRCIGMEHVIKRLAVDAGTDGGSA